jgi:Glycosyl-4,4'-diaponeurosporenoate acyltransferase
LGWPLGKSIVEFLPCRALRRRVIQSRPGTLLDFWFRPKGFETERRYQRLGALVLKRYVPTGGDWALRWLRRHRVEPRWIEGADVESLRRFEDRTRLAEAIHLVTFLGFSALAVKRYAGGSLSVFGFSVAMVSNLTLGLWPVVLQRYNRVRAYRAIESALRRRSRMAAHEGQMFTNPSPEALPRRYL